MLPVYVADGGALLEALSVLAGAMRRLHYRGQLVEDPLEARRAARLGRPRLGRRLPGADAARPIACRSRDAPAGPEFPTVPLRSVYLTDYEWAAEWPTGPCNSVMHMSWVPTSGAANASNASDASLV